MTKADVYNFQFQAILFLVRALIALYWPGTLLIFVCGVLLRRRGNVERGNTWMILAGALAALGLVVVALIWWNSLPDAPKANAQ